MPPEVFVKSGDSAVKADREKVAIRVIAEFGGALPNESLLCYFDEKDWEPFKTGPDAYGKENRGVYRQTSGPFFRPEWPPDVFERIVDGFQCRFDHVIYLHGSTCSDPIGLTITFAHELQHFRQYCQSRHLSDAGQLLMAFVRDVPISTTDSLNLTKWSDIPHEREARIVSKRIAVARFGLDCFLEYMDRSIAAAMGDEDRADLEFVKFINTDDEYDLDHETKLVFRRLKPYKEELENLINQSRTGHMENFTLDTLF